MTALYQVEKFENNQVPIKIYVHDFEGENIYTPLHWHRNIEFNLVTDGRVMSYVDGKQVIKVADEWNVINSTVIHSDHFYKKTDIFKGVTVQISKSFLDNWLGKDVWLEAPEKASEDYERVRELMLEFGELEKNKNLSNGSKSGTDKSAEHVRWNLEHSADLTPEDLAFWGDNSSTAMKLKKMELLFRFLQVINVSCISEEKNAAKRGKSEAAVKDVLNFIEEHYSENITLSQVAEVFNYSSAHLSRSFRGHVGSNFHDYLQNIRLSHSVEMLRRNPEEKLLDCAMKNGFSNVKSFINAFHRSFGCTPSVWVKNGMK